MVKNSALFLFALITIISCSQPNKLIGTWKIIDAGHDGPYYNFFKITKDSTFIYTIGLPTKSFNHTRIEQTLKLDSAISWTYAFSKDTLILNEGEDHERKLLILDSKKAIVDIEGIKNTLTNNSWKYSDGVFSYESIFEKNLLRESIYTGETHTFINNKYENTLENCLWAIDEINGQIVLVIEDNYSSFPILETFYLHSRLTDTLTFKSWNSCKEFEVDFIKQPLPTTNYLTNLRKILTSKSWKLKEHSIFQYPAYDGDTTKLVDLGTIIYGPPALPNSTIKEKDLESNSLTYYFNPDSTFKLLNRGNVVFKGTWKLFKNGKLVELIKDDAPFDYNYYQVYLKNIRIQEFDSNELVIEQWLPLYENDSTIPDEYVTMTLR